MRKCSEEEVRTAMKRRKNRKVAGPDDISVEV